MSNRYQAFIEEFEKWDTIALTAPAGADGDSVGTQCALKEYFNSCYPNKTVRIINEDPCPARYRFLRESTYFEVSEQIKGPSPELWICVDGGPNRLGDHTTELWKQAKRKAQIDHHAFSSCDLPVDIDINDDQAASTTEILFHFFNSIDFKMSPSVAEALYVGLVYDTGLFKHSNTTPEVMRMGASLLECGFDHTSAAEKTLMIKNEASLKLLNRLINRIKFVNRGRYVWSQLQQQDFKECGAVTDDREGLIDALFLTPHCLVATLFYEVGENDWKISFRSRAPNVAELAKSLDPNGGGHVLASGCRLQGSQEEVIKRANDAALKLIS